MRTPNTIEEDINRIRLAIYEETKNMTPEQCAERRERNTLEFVKKSGYRFVSHPDIPHARMLVKMELTAENAV